MAYCTSPPNMLDSCMDNKIARTIFAFSQNNGFGKRDRKILKLILNQYDVISITQEGNYDFYSNQIVKPKPYVIKYKNKFLKQDQNYPMLPETVFYWEFEQKY